MNLPYRAWQRKFLDWSASESGKAILTAFIIVSVGGASFGLGRLSATPENAGLRIIEGGAVRGVTTGELERDISETPSPIHSDQSRPPGGEVVASKNGSKYHFPWCSGAQAISQANKITFASPEEARKAGYLPASNCKGLK